MVGLHTGAGRLGRVDMASGLSLQAAAAYDMCCVSAGKKKRIVVAATGVQCASWQLAQAAARFALPDGATRHGAPCVLLYTQ
jgi:hypothetical protein